MQVAARRIRRYRLAQVAWPGADAVDSRHRRLRVARGANGANGTLRVTPTALDEGGKQTKPTKEGEAAAQSLLTACGSSR